MRCTIQAIAAVLILARAATAQVVTFNQIDTFESGSANWLNNAGLSSVSTGGPGGAADHFLQVSTNGSATGSGSRLVVSNGVQWVGNYTAQGITAVEMDLKNINYPNGGAGMSVRIVLRQSSSGQLSPSYVSNPVSLPADGLWHHAIFPLVAGNFTALNSPIAFASMLAGGVQDFRVIHNPIVDEIGGATAPVAAQLGIDNIHATGVPEPGSLAMCGLAVAGVLGWRSTARRVPDGGRATHFVR